MNTPSIILRSLLLAGCLAWGLPASSQAAPRSVAACISQAVELSPEIQQARLELRLAELTLQAARSPFYPHLDASASEILLGDDLNGARIQDPVQWTPDTYRADVTASWNLFHSTLDLRQWRSARAMLEASRQGLLQRKQDLALRVIQAYYEVLKQRKLTAVESRTLSQRKDRLAQARELFRNGSRSYSDTLGQLTQVNAAERALSFRVTAALEASARLADLLGEDPASQMDLADDLEPLPQSPAWEASRKMALLQRPELRALQATEAARREDWTHARIGQWPQLNLDALAVKDLGAYGRDRSLWTHPGDADENSRWSLTASIVFPIFHGFALSAAADSAEARLKQASAATQATQRQVLLEARQACLSLEQSLRSVDLDRELVDAAGKSLAEVQRGYQNGTASQYEVNEADAAYLSASIGQVTTLYDAQTGFAAWKRAVGQDLTQAGAP